MELIDKRSHLFELDEILKYKSLIEKTDRETIKAIIYKNDEESKLLHDEFIKLVAMEVDHQLNKTEFYELKDKLITKMKQHLDKFN